jgi:hypothetical protein
VQQPVEDEQYNSQDPSQQSAEQSSGKTGGLFDKLKDLIIKIGTMSESDDDII